MTKSSVVKSETTKSTKSVAIKTPKSHLVTGGHVLACISVRKISAVCEIPEEYKGKDFIVDEVVLLTASNESSWYFVLPEWAVPHTQGTLGEADTKDLFPLTEKKGAAKRLDVLRKERGEEDGWSEYCAIGRHIVLLGGSGDCPDGEIDNWNVQSLREGLSFLKIEIPKGLRKEEVVLLLEKQRKSDPKKVRALKKEQDQIGDKFPHWFD